MAAKPTDSVTPARHPMPTTRTEQPVEEPAVNPASAMDPSRGPGDALDNRRARGTPKEGQPAGAAPVRPVAQTSKIQEWRLGGTAKSLMHDLTRDLGSQHSMLIDRAVRYPVHKLERREVALLTNAPVSMRTPMLVASELC